MAQQLVVAIDIGATKTLLSVRETGELASGWQRPGATLRTESPADAATLVEWVVAEVRRMRTVLGGRIAAIGVAAPGPLDAASGVITRSSNLGWHDVPIATMLQSRLDVPVALEDDANAAALGEWHFGAGRGADPCGYLTVSSGIGGGVVAGGRLVRGAGGNAGEVGHLAVAASGPRCACGRRGDVEAFAGGNALVRRARSAWPGGQLADGSAAPRSAEALFRAARAGDPQARRLVEDAAGALAVALAAMSAVIDPAVIVVGGSIALGQRRLIRRATTLARARVMRENGVTLRVVPAALGDQSVLAGAADLGLRLLPGR